MHHQDKTEYIKTCFSINKNLKKIKEKVKQNKDKDREEIN